MMKPREQFEADVIFRNGLPVFLETVFQTTFLICNSRYLYIINKRFFVLNIDTLEMRYIADEASALRVSVRAIAQWAWTIWYQ